MDSHTSAAFELRQKYKYFRILVIGRANAGKTTLLKRVCNTTEEPCIYDEEKNLLEPTGDRGTHDIHRSFAFASNPGFIFHDSPGFETGDVNQLKEVQQFIADHARATDVKDQIHAIWFCLVTNGSRPLLELEKKFFDEKQPGNVPVIVIFTKFDDLVNQIYDPDMEEEQNCEAAMDYLLEKFKKPLLQCRFPPKAHLVLKGMKLGLSMVEDI
ncbi:hypothetical protein GYMLUDRAFT_253307 [Collybiopsis luxurians FD-317 M1]|uniref:G domain-containing protein n=1 Tax=Collybiopsis luxurians FD-317 M1 TaxID=944289 RepID=A0A0D0AIV1_9AGAR|nr:hypothetical protein GYMLUDRAFT_253307 [Collybiopsis luxurians FD-317 M1]